MNTTTKYSVEITPDVQLYSNVIVRIMREQGVSLLRAELILKNTIDDAVTYVREQVEAGELK